MDFLKRIIGISYQNKNGAGRFWPFSTCAKIFSIEFYVSVKIFLDQYVSK